MYQWQVKLDAGKWDDIPGANSKNYVPQFSAAGVYSYRMIIADAPVFALSQCRTYSNEVQ
jgi:hypothetical protein